MNILVFPGTLWQIPLAKKIKEMGHQLFVVNPASNSPCFKYADDYLQEDIFHREKILEYCKRKQIRAIISDECDIAMPLVASYGKSLNAKSIDEESAQLYTNKHEMREFCKRHNLNTPEYCLCQTVHDAISFFRQLNAPIILKPLDSNASHGIYKVSSETEILNHFNDSLAFSRVKKLVLAERFIEGTEFTIDGIKTPSTHYTLAISEKKHYKHNVNIANELYFSHSNTVFDYEQLKATNDAFVSLSNLPFGFTHAEYKYENGKFYLIEIAARGGGNMISSVITQFMSGHDTYRYLVDCYTIGAYEVDFSIPKHFRNRVAILKFFETPQGGGKVESIEGLNILNETKGIVFFKLNFEIGDTIIEAPNDSARIGFYIACAQSDKELKEIISTVDKKFKIVINESSSICQ